MRNLVTHGLYMRVVQQIDMGIPHGNIIDDLQRFGVD